MRSDGRRHVPCSSQCRPTSGSFTEAQSALRERNDGFALCVSDPVYQGTVRHGYPGIPAEGFRQVTGAGITDRSLVGWLNLPKDQRPSRLTRYKHRCPNTTKHHG